MGTPAKPRQQAGVPPPQSLLVRHTVKRPSPVHIVADTQRLPRARLVRLPACRPKQQVPPGQSAGSSHSRLTPPPHDEPSGRQRATAPTDTVTQHDSLLESQAEVPQATVPGVELGRSGPTLSNAASLTTTASRTPPSTAPVRPPVPALFVLPPVPRWPPVPPCPPVAAPRPSAAASIPERTPPDPPIESSETCRSVRPQPAKSTDEPRPAPRAASAPVTTAARTAPRREASRVGTMRMGALTTRTAPTSS